MARQISIFLERKQEKLSQVARILGESGINIRALSIADTSDFGILRIIVNDPSQAYRILHDAGFTINETEVFAVKVPDSPGGLGLILEQMAEENLNIEYLYAYLGNTGHEALIIFKIEDHKKAREALTKKGIKFLEEEELYQL